MAVSPFQECGIVSVFISRVDGRFPSIPFAERRAPMKTLVGFAFFVVISSAQAFAADGNVPHSSLAKMGLSGMQRMDDARGMQIRGSFGQLRLAKGLSSLERAIVNDLGKILSQLPIRSPGGPAGGKP
jgi:hypothetical protein